MAQLFGFEIKRASKDREEQPSFVLPDSDDGANVYAGFYSQYLDLDAAAKNEYDLIQRYRGTSEHPECDFAIELHSLGTFFTKMQLPFKFLKN